jgi:hypothetical protein
MPDDYRMARLTSFAKEYSFPSDGLKQSEARFVIGWTAQKEKSLPVQYLQTIAPSEEK